MKTPITSYLIWIPITIVYNFLACWVAVRYNAKDFIKTWLGCAIVGIIPTWSIAAYLSKNLILDGLIYDSTLVISSIPIFILLGEGHGLTTTNWIGIILALCGVLLARL